MPIHPLPVFEADADPHHRTALTDEEQYAALEPPKSIVVRFGGMYQVAEYPYDGDAKPGCGTKLVARTQRGTELVEMLTTTCENAGCSKSITRQEMREYIENSGGRDYPFSTNGRILRVATRRGHRPPVGTGPGEAALRPHLPRADRVGWACP